MLDYLYIFDEINNDRFVAYYYCFTDGSVFWTDDKRVSGKLIRALKERKLTPILMAYCMILFLDMLYVKRILSVKLFFILAVAYIPISRSFHICKRNRLLREIEKNSIKINMNKNDIKRLFLTKSTEKSLMIQGMMWLFIIITAAVAGLLYYPNHFYDYRTNIIIACLMVVLLLSITLIDMFYMDVLPHNIIRLMLRLHE